MTRRQDLKEEWLIVAELRWKKAKEIRELLSISRNTDAEEVLTIMKWWRETGDGSIPAKLKSFADRLLREFHRLDEVNLEILRELGAIAPATTSSLKYRGTNALAATGCLVFVCCLFGICGSRM
jgi:hypothetical protein